MPLLRQQTVSEFRFRDVLSGAVGRVSALRTACLSPLFASECMRTGSVVCHHRQISRRAAHNPVTSKVSLTITYTMYVKFRQLFCNVGGFSCTTLQADQSCGPQGSTCMLVIVDPGMSARGISRCANDNDDHTSVHHLDLIPWQDRAALTPLAHCLWPPGRIITPQQLMHVCCVDTVRLRWSQRTELRRRRSAPVSASLRGQLTLS